MDDPTLLEGQQRPLRSLGFLPYSPTHLCYDSAPRAEPLLPEHTPRSKRPANSTKSILSWQERLCINAAAYART